MSTDRNDRCAELEAVINRREAGLKEVEDTFHEELSQFCNSHGEWKRLRCLEIDEQLAAECLVLSTTSPEHLALVENEKHKARVLDHGHRMWLQN
jgi:hypothetical protein